MNVSKPTALISVTDKSGLVDFARALRDLGFRFLSTGGSAAALREAGLEVEDVADYTQSPECLDGRVKTLHPKIHGGILMDRATHAGEASALGIRPIDLVVVNLYDFAGRAMSCKLSLAEAINYIDIGGPTMLRAAAKNYRFVLPILDPRDYPKVLSELKGEGLSLGFRRQMAAKTFAAISRYDAMISRYFDMDEIASENVQLELSKIRDLRYGENPHQSAALYQRSGEAFGLPQATILQGKELSYNNYIDIDAALQLVLDLSPDTAVAIIKHTNPCGVARSADEPLHQVFSRALRADPKSAFGGIVAVNQPIDASTAKQMAEIFFECIVAPEISDDAQKILARKKNLRVLITRFDATIKSSILRQIMGGYLMQTPDELIPIASELNVVTSAKPSSSEIADLIFAQTVAKHVKSNAIVLARGGETLGIGAGQMSRIDALEAAVRKAEANGVSLHGAVLASDAFFPFRDSVDLAAQHGIKSIIQPGGSQRDQESIDACDSQGIAMVFSGVRHFRH